MPRPFPAPPTARRALAAALLAGSGALGTGEPGTGEPGTGEPAASAGPPSAVTVSPGAMARLRNAPGNFERNAQTGTDPATDHRPGGSAPATAGPPGGGDRRDDAPGEGARPPAPVLSGPVLPAPVLPAPVLPAPVLPAPDPPPAAAAEPVAPAGTAYPADWLPDGPGVTVRDWGWVVVHHTATAAGSVESIDAAHRARVSPSGVPWRGVGYHFVVGNGRGMPDGAVEPTFRWRGQLAGAHAGVRDYNSRGVGIALVGDFTKRDPTPAQLAAARELIAFLRAEYDLPAGAVIGHGDVKPTACPGGRLDVAALAGGESSDSSPPSVVGPPGTHDAP